MRSRARAVTRNNSFSHNFVPKPRRYGQPCSENLPIARCNTFDGVRWTRQQTEDTLPLHNKSIWTIGQFWSRPKNCLSFFTNKRTTREPRVTTGLGQLAPRAVPIPLVVTEPETTALWGAVLRAVESIHLGPPPAVDAHAVAGSCAFVHLAVLRAHRNRATRQLFLCFPCALLLAALPLLH